MVDNSVWSIPMVVVDFDGGGQPSAVDDNSVWSISMVVDNLQRWTTLGGGQPSAVDDTRWWTAFSGGRHSVVDFDGVADFDGGGQPSAVDDRVWGGFRWCEFRWCGVDFDGVWRSVVVDDARWWWWTAMSVAVVDGDVGGGCGRRCRWRWWTAATVGRVLSPLFSL